MSEVAADPVELQLREQAAVCAAMGSRFSGSLLDAAAQDYRERGSLWRFFEADPRRRDLPIVVTLTVAGDELTVDLNGTAPQVDDKPINMPLVGTVDCAVWLTLRSILLVLTPLPPQAPSWASSSSVAIARPRRARAGPARGPSRRTATVSPAPASRSPA